MAFPEALSALMSEKGFTAERLADATGVSADFIRKVLRGDRAGVSAETLFAFCDAMGVDCNYFRPHLAKVHPAVAPPAPGIARGKRK